jgi:5-methylcytosine-specific restriction endonuclease McrA
MGYKRRYSLFETCNCGRLVQIVYDRHCCGIDHLQNSFSQANDGEKEWQYHLAKIEKCLHRFNKAKAKKGKLTAANRKNIQQEQMKLQKPKRIAYYDSIGRLRMKNNIKPWGKKINDKLRHSVLERDGYKCVKCSSTENLHAHHKTHRSDGGEDALENLTTLCELCHAEEHRGEPIYSLMVKKLFVYKTG